MRSWILMFALAFGMALAVGCKEETTPPTTPATPTDTAPADPATPPADAP